MAPKVLTLSHLDLATQPSNKESVFLYATVQIFQLLIPKFLYMRMMYLKLKKHMKKPQHSFQHLHTKQLFFVCSMICMRYKITVWDGPLRAGVTWAVRHVFLWVCSRVENSAIQKRSIIIYTMIQFNTHSYLYICNLSVFMEKKFSGSVTLDQAHQFGSNSNEVRHIPWKPT